MCNCGEKTKEPIKTFAIGMSEDAIDLKYARQVSDYIGSDHTEVYMTPQEVLASLETVIYLLGTYDITTIRASMGMYLVCKAIHEHTDIRVLLTGRFLMNYLDISIQILHQMQKLFNENLRNEYVKFICMMFFVRTAVYL